MELIILTVLWGGPLDLEVGAMDYFEKNSLLRNRLEKNCLLSPGKKIN